MTVAVHCFTCRNELDPVLDLGHPSVHTMAGALTTKAYHANLSESELMISFQSYLCALIDMVNTFDPPSIFRNHQGASRVSLT